MNVKRMDTVRPYVGSISGRSAAGNITIDKALSIAARANSAGVVLTRAALVLVLVWIGGLKAFSYEAESIVPFVANSPLMSFFYKYPAPAYAQHMNAAGAEVAANRSWHEENHTYAFAYLLGSSIVCFGLMIALHPWIPQVAALGSLLVFLMSFITLSFLITTPEVWVPALGSVHHGFPLLAAPGRLVIKDAIMMGAALVTMSDSARVSLRRKRLAAIRF